MTAPGSSCLWHRAGISSWSGQSCSSSTNPPKITLRHPPGAAPSQIQGKVAPVWAGEAARSILSHIPITPLRFPRASPLQNLPCQQTSLRGHERDKREVRNQHRNPGSHHSAPIVPGEGFGNSEGFGNPGRQLEPSPVKLCPPQAGCPWLLARHMKSSVLPHVERPRWGQRGQRLGQPGGQGQTCRGDSAQKCHSRREKPLWCKNIEFLL